MTREKPNNSFSERVKARDRANPLGYVTLPMPSSFRAASSPQVATSTGVVLGSNSQPSHTDARSANSDGHLSKLDQTEDDKTTTPAVAPEHGPSTDAIKRKRALSDEDDIPTVSGSNRVAKANTSKRTIVSAGSKRRKASKPAFAGLTGFDIPDDVEALLQTVSANTPSADANEQNEKVKIPPAKRAKVTAPALPVSQTFCIRTIGTKLKTERRNVLQTQIKPVKRLLARPRFLRQAKDDHGSRDPSTAAVLRKYEGFLDILEPGLPCLKSAVASSKDLSLDANADVGIARGPSATAREHDPEDGSNQTEKPEDNKTSAIKAKKLTKWENTLLAHDGLNRALPPINTLPDIFSDMVEGGWNDKKRRHLQDAVEHVRGREIRVGTACSGTECPVLALELMNDALTRKGRVAFSFTHVFSCEIVPFKQAYIQRNFNPQYLFRDVTELPGEQASTAYGSAVKVPGDLDILIAGSSCKDYSNLNAHPKQYGEDGTSKSTFNGVLGYVRRHKPRMVILENVKSGPWERFQLEFQGIGYATLVVRVDTKDFYIPQTRNRGYMFAFNREFAAMAGLQLEGIETAWADAFEAYTRRASSPFVDFLLPEDDPRLDQLRLEMIISQSIENSGTRVGWVKSRQRHFAVRSGQSLGFGRPVTMWENNGTCKFPDSSWLKWAKGQVERVWDIVDINHLRCVSERDYDNRWKIRMIELSQNVDRNNETSPWGITACITPTGMPYLTTRGGPITGLESLALQGIPIDKLSLTYETGKNLQDFAGNAMTSTAIAAAMFSAFGVGYKILEKGSGATTPNLQIPDIDFSDLSNDGTDNPRTEKLLPIEGIDPTSFAEIQRLSSITMQLCSCEGRYGRSRGPFQRCTSCGHTTCAICGQNPSHKYELIPQLISDKRRDPSDFEGKIKNWLPLQVEFRDPDIPCLSFSGNAAISKVNHRVMQAIIDAFKYPLHLTGFSRTKAWTAIFESAHARLDIVFSRRWVSQSSSSHDLTEFLGEVSVQCYLYAKAGAKEPVESLVRADLTQPIARTICKQSIFDEGWEIRIPRPTDFALDITYSGKCVDSWEANLGLQNATFRDRQVTETVTLSRSPESDSQCPQEIPGVYELLPNCDSASGSLYRKLDDAGYDSGLNSHPVSKTDPVFFFLDPGLLCNAAQDSLVFAKTHHRLPLGSGRDVLAQTEKGWRLASSPSNTIPCTIPGKWQKCGNARLDVPENGGVHIKMSVPESAASAKVHVIRCTRADLTALVCSFPLREDQQKQWVRGKVYSIDLTDKLDALRPFTQLVQRAGLECGFEDWVEIAIPSPAIAVCPTCAPAKPRLLFPTIHCKSLVENDKAEKPLLVEDQHQAFQFENKMKARPSPVLAELHCHEGGIGNLQLQLNVTTLVHRAYGKLVGQASPYAPLSRIQWRLAKESGFEQLPPFPKLSLRSNAEDLECEMPLNWVKHEEMQLYRPQLKSLRWMLEQESETATPWVEEETEEARMPAANLRLEAKAECTRRIRGGILADEVGYGKTATILALFDSDASDAHGGKRLQTTSIATPNGKIKIKATLVLAPADLLKQWHSEFDKFLYKEPSAKYVVLLIESEIALKKLTIEEICHADLILSTWNVFGDWYIGELAHLSRSRQLPKRPGRAFQQWLSEALRDLGIVVMGSEDRGYTDYTPGWEKLDTLRPKRQRYYDTHQGPEEDPVAEAKEVMDKNFKVVDVEKRNDTKIAPLLHLFCFRRVVTDEFTYVQGKHLSLLLQLDASRKWALSGTPPLGSFREVNKMAMILGTKLSNDDNDGGLFESRSVLREKMKDKTLAEEFQFYSYQTRHSPSWYEARNKSCEKFVEHFIRKNPAELKGVDLFRHYEVFDLAAAERATYFELFQILVNQPLKFMANPKKKPDNAVGCNRTTRLIHMASNSSSPEEALLICCSTPMSAVNGVEAYDRSARKVCEAILAEQKKHFIAKVQDFYGLLTEIFKLWKDGHRDDPMDNPHFYSFIRSIQNNVFGDLDAKATLGRVIRHAEAGVDQTAENSPVIPPSTHTLAEPPKAARESLWQKEKRAMTAKKSKRDATVDEPAEESFQAERSEAAGAEAATRKNAPSMTTLGARNTSMYHSAATLTNLALLIVDHMRGIRIHNSISGFVNLSTLPSCSKCGKQSGNAMDVLIMGLCGHASCDACFKTQHASRTAMAECLAEGCEARAHRLSALRLSDLNTTTSDLAHPFGSKIDAVLTLLQETSRVGTEDRIVIFVQWQRLKVALIEALKVANIGFLDGSNRKAVEKFKSGGAMVCVLDPESADAAGWNLQIANHVIFLSSLVIDTQYSYESIFEQAIGRVYRRGQKKAVHIYHFLAARTIDVNILEDRENKTLVQRDGKYLLLTQSEVRGSDKQDLAGAPFEGAACGMDD